MENNRPTWNFNNKVFSALQEGLTQVWELCGAHIKTEIFYDEGNKWTLNKDSNYTEDAIDLFFKINCLTAKKVFAPSLSFKKHRLFGQLSLMLETLFVVARKSYIRNCPPAELLHLFTPLEYTAPEQTLRSISDKCKLASTINN